MFSEIFNSYKHVLAAAMYKTRNTGTGNGMRGKRGIGGMLHSSKYLQTFQEMLLNIPGNFLKRSGGYRETFRGMP